MSDTVISNDLDAAIAADEAAIKEARLLELKGKPETNLVDTTEQVEKTEDTTDTETTDETDVETKDVEPELDARLARAFHQARQAKDEAARLRNENAILKGNKTETRDENIEREANAMAERIATAKIFQTQCERVAAAGNKEFKDFETILGSLWGSVGGFRPELVDAAIEAADSDPSGTAKILRHLGKNPDIAEDLINMTPARQAVAITKISAKVNAPVVKQVSKAPPPLKNVSGGVKSVDTAQPDVDKMSMEEFAKYEDKRDNDRRKARF